MIFAFDKSWSFELILSYPTQKIPAATAASIPLALSSITIQFAIGATDKLAAYSKIAGWGFDFGKSSPETICEK